VSWVRLCRDTKRIAGLKTRRHANRDSLRPRWRQGYQATRWCPGMPDVEKAKASVHLTPTPNKAYSADSRAN